MEKLTRYLPAIDQGHVILEPTQGNAVDTMLFIPYNELSAFVTRGKEGGKP